MTMWDFLRARIGATCCMMGCIAVILGLILSLTIMSASSESKVGDNRVLALVMFRHGQKNPTSSYPTDPYREENQFWPDGWGALTNPGKTNAYNFGKWLRERYAQLVPELYSEKNVQIISSDVDRCHMSAQLCLAGLFPPKGRQIWDNQLLWQPIPVHAVPQNLDKLILLRRKCPKYEEEYKELSDSIGSNLTDLYQYLSKNSGMNVTNDLDVETLYNILEIEDKSGLKLPEWTKSVYPTSMRYVAFKAQRLFTKTTSMRRFMGGPLVSDVIKHVTEKMETQNEKKLYLYSAHDMTLLAVMEALGIDYFFMPDHLDALIFELYQNPDNDFRIQVSYLNHTENMRVQSLNVLGLTESSIPVATFKSLAAPVIPIDWDKECQIESRS